MLIGVRDLIGSGPASCSRSRGGAILALSATLSVLAIDAAISRVVSAPTASRISQQQPASTVLLNGTVYTVNPSQPWAQAVAVRGDQIVYVGSNQGARALIGKGSRTIDLKGKLLLPGFVESHIHVLMGAATTSGVSLTMTDTLADIQRKLKTYADANPTKPAIFGSAYNGLLFGEQGPKREWLDAVVPDRPVMLADHTIHTMWANSKALEVAGITKDTPNPPGGEYVRDSAGNPTGTIKGGPASVPVVRATGVITAAKDPLRPVGVRLHRSDGFRQSDRYRAGRFSRCEARSAGQVAAAAEPDAHREQP
jgi:hypothetical protein